MPDMFSKENQKRVQNKWDASAKDKVENRPRKFALHSRVIQRTINTLYFNEEGNTAAYIKKKYFNDIEIGHALELGSGIGDLALHVMNTAHPRKLTAFDLSSYSVNTGNQRAQEENLPIQFEQVDLNDFSLDANHYDLIYSSQAVHHVENLENFFAQVNRALTPNGVFFCNDYMGPNHQQWTEVQLDIMNRLVETFPDRFARNSLRNNSIDKSIRRIPLEAYKKGDWSEGVRASDILRVLEENLEIIELHPKGMTVLYELLRGRVHNFDDAEEKDAFILRLLAVFEKILIDYEVIGSDFNLVVARKKTL